MSLIQIKIKLQFCFVFFRPFFTYWVTFVQIVCYFIAVAVYQLSTIGISETKIEGQVKFRHNIVFTILLASLIISVYIDFIVSYVSMYSRNVMWIEYFLLVNGFCLVYPKISTFDRYKFLHSILSN